MTTGRRDKDGADWLQQITAEGLLVRVCRWDYSLNAFQRVAGVQRNLLSAYERGKHKPSPLTLDRVMRARGVDPGLREPLLGAMEDLARILTSSGRLPVRLQTDNSLPVAQVAESLRCGSGSLRLELQVEPARPDNRALLAPLLACSAAERLAVIKVSPRCRTWAMVELLCAESIEAASKDAAVAGEIAELALMAAELVDVPWRDVLMGYAWAHVGNALRVLGELNAADLVFAWVDEFWSPADAVAVGVLDPGLVGMMTASLRRAQRRGPEALHLLDEILPISWKPGWVLLNRAKTLEDMGDYATALAALRRADQLLVHRTARDQLALRLNLGVLFCHLGRFDEAAALVPRALHQAEVLGNNLDSIRGLWLEGRVAKGLGRQAEGRAAFERVREAFASRDMVYDLALVSLELTELHLQEGRWPEVLGMSAELVGLFEERGVHREALGALRLFHDAALAQAATLDLARRLVDYLYRARYDESLPFDSRLTRKA